MMSENYKKKDSDDDNDDNDGMNDDEGKDNETQLVVTHEDEEPYDGKCSLSKLSLE